MLEVSNDLTHDRQRQVDLGVSELFDLESLRKHQHPALRHLFAGQILSGQDFRHVLVHTADDREHGIRLLRPADLQLFFDCLLERQEDLFGDVLVVLEVLNGLLHGRAILVEQPSKLLLAHDVDFGDNGVGLLQGELFDVLPQGRNPVHDLLACLLRPGRGIVVDFAFDSLPHDGNLIIHRLADERHDQVGISQIRDFRVADREIDGHQRQEKAAHNQGDPGTDLKATPHRFQFAIDCFSTIGKRLGRRHDEYSFGELMILERLTNARYSTDVSSTFIAAKCSKAAKNCCCSGGSLAVGNSAISSSSHFSFNPSISFFTLSE